MENIEAKSEVAFISSLKFQNVTPTQSNTIQNFKQRKIFFGNDVRWCSPELGSGQKLVKIAISQRQF